jgi:hypothetical protein
MTVGRIRLLILLANLAVFVVLIYLATLLWTLLKT